VSEVAALDRLLTSKEAADLLAVSQRWVEEHARLGTIPHIRLGRFVRFRYQSLLDWIVSLEHGAPIRRA
jgi:excisionase family DNA binding protein